MSEHSTRQSVSCDKKIGFDNCTDVSNFPRQNYSRSDSHLGICRRSLELDQPFFKIFLKLFSKTFSKTFFKTFLTLFFSFPMTGNLVAGITVYRPGTALSNALLPIFPRRPVSLMTVIIYVSRGGSELPKLSIMS